MRYVGPRQIVVDDRPAPVPLWAPDRTLDGRAVVIVGGGPSHAAIDLDLLQGVRFVAVNSSCRKVRPIATEADILYFSDNSWNERFPDLAADWPGLVVSCNRHVKARLGDAVRRLAVPDLADRIGALPDHVGASSGHVAACLAAVMGARRIVLIGFEGRVVDGRTHGHSDYSMPDPAPLAEQFVPGWHGLAPAFDRLGVEVVNATPASAIGCFPVLSLREALA